MSISVDRLSTKGGEGMAEMAEGYTDRANAEKLQADIERERIAKRNAGFLMFFKKSTPELMILIRDNAPAATVLLAMCGRMNRQNAIVISAQALIEITGYKRSTISKAITALSDGNWVQIVKIGNMNAYVLNSAVVWQSYGNLKHTVFNATIYGTMTDQDEKSKELIRAGKETKLKNLNIVTVSPENKKPPRLDDLHQPELFD